MGIRRPGGNNDALFWWGDVITAEKANYGKKNVGKTTPAGVYPPNSWGLYDMNGNVWEWVEECWHDNYDEKGTSG